MPRNNQLPSPSTAPRETHLQRFRRDLVSIPYSRMAKAASAVFFAAAAASQYVTSINALKTKREFIELAHTLGIQITKPTYFTEVAMALRNPALMTGSVVLATSLLSDTLKACLRNRNNISRGIRAQVDSAVRAFNSIRRGRNRNRTQ